MKCVHFHLHPILKGNINPLPGTTWKIDVATFLFVRLLIISLLLLLFLDKRYDFKNKNE